MYCSAMHLIKYVKSGYPHERPNNTDLFAQAMGLDEYLSVLHPEAKKAPRHKILLCPAEKDGSQKITVNTPDSTEWKGPY